MDTVTTTIGISVLFAKVMQWGVPQLILAVLMIIAAFRHRMVGLWLLAVAAVITFITSVWMRIIIRHSGGSPSDFRLVQFPNFLALLISIVGWALIAFSRTKRSHDDA